MPTPEADKGNVVLEGRRSELVDQIVDVAHRVSRASYCTAVWGRLVTLVDVMQKLPCARSISAQLCGKCFDWVKQGCAQCVLEMSSVRLEEDVIVGIWKFGECIPHSCPFQPLVPTPYTLLFLEGQRWCYTSHTEVGELEGQERGP